MQTHVTFVLDSSGSMSSIREDTIGGFNSFLEDQTDEEGSATVSLYEFNTDVELLYETRPIEGAPKLTTETYTPGGQTALNDAIHIAIYETEQRVQSMAPIEQPDNVVIVVLTDGKENASETPHKRVREQVETMRAEHNWDFLFIGANQDAALTADSMGMDTENSLEMAHNSDGTQAAYDSTSDRISEVRREGSIDGYDDDDRSRQDEARDN